MKTKLFVLTTLGITLSACTNDNDEMIDGQVAAVINADISNSVLTRASGTAWADSDEIGISESRFGYNNVPYRWESGKFTPAGTIIFFQDDDPTTFSAYYPYDSNGGTLTATTDATAQQNQPAIDFLYATGATASTHNPEVNFTDDTDAGGTDCSFHSGVDFSTIQPTGYTLSGLVLEGSFDTTTGTAETDDATAAQDLDMTLTNGALTSSVILFPQTKASIGLSVYYNSQPYTATLDIPDGALKAGNNYTYTVTVRNKDLSVSSATISDWNPVNGGNVNADL